MSSTAKNPVADVDTHELDRMLAVHEESQKIGTFLDWLQSNGRQLATRHYHTRDCKESGEFICGYQSEELQPLRTSIEELLAEYFEIDLKECEREREALLAAVRGA